MKSSFILFLLAVVTSFSWGQANREIEGRVLDVVTREPVAFANVYNKSLQKGTITNDDGYFRVVSSGTRDSIMVIFIGYETQIIKLSAQQDFYTIYLEESIQLLKEIVVTPNDNLYLFDLLVKCRNKASSFQTDAKAYYELKTFRDEQQIELVEGYYNAAIAGYELSGLSLKAGRLAMQPYDNRFFASMESSTAITAMKLLSNNSNFPDSPLELSKKEMRKSFDLSLDKKYVDSNADSIYVITYEPTDKAGFFFDGSIWVNKTNNTILKIILNCLQCKKFPFQPIFPGDTISNVSFAITKTFTTQQGHPAFKHIDFAYIIDYRSRVGEAYAQSYIIKSNAILYAYDFSNTFMIPTFNVTDGAYSDYRKINAMPYNDFFWRYNDEYRLKDGDNSNELFFNDIYSFTNKTIFKSNSLMKSRLFQHPYIIWSEDRVFFKDIAMDTSAASPSADVLADKYNLGVKLFVDINTYQDSTSIFSATIFDPYVSFYHLPIDNKAHCFINMYFDICEIERRILEGELKAAVKDVKQFDKSYHELETRFQAIKTQYLKEVDRGTNEPEMRKWNSYVREYLSIDNIAIFKPYDVKG
jgi:hypothetical protein